MTRTALITGITGQDGAYLAKLLLGKGYRVIGARRRFSTSGAERLRELRILREIEFAEFDLAAPAGMAKVLERLRPDEIYNLAAQSDVARSFRLSAETVQANLIGTLNLLEAVCDALPSARLYQASTSDMFGLPQTIPQNETTPFDPRSPYGRSKAAAHLWTALYRESYGVQASCGILYNHESPLRGCEFVTRKITRSLAAIRYGELDMLELGNLDNERDWGFAGDYVRGMWLMLQHPEAQDFVLATGKVHSVRCFVETAAEHLGFDIVWSGSGVDERGFDRRSGKTIVQVNPDFYRPVDVTSLVGNPAKARDILGWRPTVAFPELVAMMAAADARRVRDGFRVRRSAGFASSPDRAPQLDANRVPIRSAGQTRLIGASTSAAWSDGSVPAGRSNAM